MIPIIPTGQHHMLFLIVNITDSKLNTTAVISTILIRIYN